MREVVERSQLHISAPSTGLLFLQENQELLTQSDMHLCASTGKWVGENLYVCKNNSVYFQTCLNSFPNSDHIQPDGINLPIWLLL